MKKLIALVLAAVGTAGLVQIRLIEVSPSPTVKLVMAAGLALALIGVGIFRWKRPHRASAELRPYLDNPVRRRRKPWQATSKRLHIAVPSTGGDRRDAAMRSELMVRNRSQRRLPSVKFPLAGDSWARDGDLTVSTEVDGKPTTQSVKYENGNSPVVSLSLPAPGLEPDSVVPVAFTWRWPGIASIKGGIWILSLRDMPSGADAEIQIDYPANLPQTANAKLVRAVGPVEWDVEQGSVSPASEEDIQQFKFACKRGRFDSYLAVEMSAAKAAKPAHEQT
jgi:hypothetical protein